MPRSIIDTESSRPIYRRRLLRRMLLAVLVLALWLLHRAPPTRVSQGKIGAGRNLSQLALKETSCFVV